MILHIDTLSTIPIYEQLRNQIVLGIARKQLIANEDLPSVRRLAADLGINLHTVNKAYAQLADEGYISMDRRRGAVVSAQTRTDAGFISNLSERLSLLAAESICHEVNEADFVKLCSEAYNNTKGVIS